MFSQQGDASTSFLPLKLQLLYHMFFKKKSLIYICDKTTSEKCVVHMFGHTVCNKICYRHVGFICSFASMQQKVVTPDHNEFDQTI